MSFSQNVVLTKYLISNVTQEYSVQKLVEQPYVYLLAQSGSAVKDQLLYVPTRWEDIDDLSTKLEFDGQRFTDKLRFFSGDNPARQLESGQQCGGK